MSKIEIGVVMGSQSDWSVMREATAVLDVLELGYECKIVSAHRTPDRLWQYGETAGQRGLKLSSRARAGRRICPACLRPKRLFQFWVCR